MRPTTLTAYRWELRKLVSQKRTYIGLGAAALLPVLFVVVLSLQKGEPHDAPLAFNLRHTGVVLALVVLTFASRFGAQLLTALVAGDIVATEDSSGTLKLILTRSLKRSQILAGKVLASFTYAGALLASLLITAFVSGTIAWGFKPVTNISFQQISAAHALALTFPALGIFLVPLLGIAAFGIFLSALTRNSAASIVGTLVYELLQEAIGGLVHVGVDQASPPLHPVRGLARLLPDADRLGNRRPRALGLGDLRRDSAGGRLLDLLAPRRRRRVDRALYKLSARSVV